MSGYPKVETNLPFGFEAVIGFRLQADCSSYYSQKPDLTGLNEHL